MSVAARLRFWFEHQSPSELVSAYLFGSEARGRAHRESDVDVGLLFDRPKSRAADSRGWTRVDWIGKLEGALGGRAVDVVDLAEAPPLLARAIVEDGIRVYCRDAKIDGEFRLTARSRAFDLAPWWQRIERLKLEALAPR